MVLGIEVCVFEGLFPSVVTPPPLEAINDFYRISNKKMVTYKEYLLHLLTIHNLIFGLQHLLSMIRNIWNIQQQRPFVRYIVRAKKMFCSRFVKLVSSKCMNLTD